MPTIAEKIVANIKLTLEGITVAAGYANTVAKVFLWEAHDQQATLLPCITVAAMRDEPTTFLSSECKKHLHVTLVLKVAPADPAQLPAPTPTWNLLKSLAADVQKALLQGESYKRGNDPPGSIEDTRVESEDLEPLESDDGLPTCTLEVIVPYRHRWEDPSVYP